MRDAQPETREQRLAEVARIAERIERDPILDGPDRANRAHVCPLRAEERVQVQTLGVIQRQFHRVFLFVGY